MFHYFHLPSTRLAGSEVVIDLIFISPVAIGPVREFQKASAELAAELERAAPNMKALEQYEAVKEKEREQVSLRLEPWHQ